MLFGDNEKKKQRQDNAAFYQKLTDAIAAVELELEENNAV